MRINRNQRFLFCIGDNSQNSETVKFDKHPENSNGYILQKCDLVVPLGRLKASWDDVEFVPRSKRDS
jgi:hypothetical protein